MAITWKKIEEPTDLDSINSNFTIIDEKIKNATVQLNYLDALKVVETCTSADTLSTVFQNLVAYTALVYQGETNATFAGQTIYIGDIILKDGAGNPLIIKGRQQYYPTPYVDGNQITATEKQTILKWELCTDIKTSGYDANKNVTYLPDIPTKGDIGVATPTIGKQSVFNSTTNIWEPSSIVLDVPAALNDYIPSIKLFKQNSSSLEELNIDSTWITYTVTKNTDQAGSCTINITNNMPSSFSPIYILVR